MTNHIGKKHYLHGKKRYLQVLLDPNRTAILDELAFRAGMRPTAYIRELVYSELQRQHPSLYELAAEDDAKLWKQSVANRIAGRKHGGKK